MGKMRTGFRDLAELEKWDYFGQEVHKCYGMDYVWILCEVNCIVPHFVKGKNGQWVKTKNLDTITMIEPCRFFISTRRAVIVDNFGNDRKRQIVAWKPIETLISCIDGKGEKW